MSIVFVICNALDDATRLHRGIVTDSPAASRKIFNMCQAFRLNGVRAYVLSLGRGKANGKNVIYSAFSKIIFRVPIIYAPFSHINFLSEVLSLFGLIYPLIKYRSHKNCAVIFYNRMGAYLPALWVANILGYRCFLDLEDGEVSVANNKFSLKSLFVEFVKKQFDFFCKDGALLACSSLVGMTSIRPVQCYYGTVVPNKSLQRSWMSPVTHILMSGTLSFETGAPLLIEFIELLRLRRPKWANKLCFEITGKGEYLSIFEKISLEGDFPKIVVHGRITDLEYSEVLERCQIGLALKPRDGFLANTTFPSKVVEFAGAGLLVVTTDISDVRVIFGDSAVYLKESEAEILFEKLADIMSRKPHYANLARCGRLLMIDKFDPHAAGRILSNFVFGDVYEK